MATPLHAAFAPKKKKRRIIPLSEVSSVPQLQRTFESRRRTLVEKAKEIEVATGCKVIVAVSLPKKSWYYATDDDLETRLLRSGVLHKNYEKLTNEDLFVEIQDKAAHKSDANLTDDVKFSGVNDAVPPKPNSKRNDAGTTQAHGAEYTPAGQNPDTKKTTAQHCARTDTLCDTKTKKTTRKNTFNGGKRGPNSVNARNACHGTKGAHKTNKSNSQDVHGLHPLTKKKISPSNNTECRGPYKAPQFPRYHHIFFTDEDLAKEIQEKSASKLTDTPELRPAASPVSDASSVISSDSDDVDLSISSSSFTDSEERILNFPDHSIQTHTTITVIDGGDNISYRDTKLDECKSGSYAGTNVPTLPEKPKSSAWSNTKAAAVEEKIAETKICDINPDQVTALPGKSAKVSVASRKKVGVKVTDTKPGKSGLTKNRSQKPDKSADGLLEPGKKSVKERNKVRFDNCIKAENAEKNAASCPQKQAKDSLKLKTEVGTNCSRPNTKHGEVDKTAEKNSAHSKPFAAVTLRPTQADRPVESGKKDNDNGRLGNPTVQSRLIKTEQPTNNPYAWMPKIEVAKAKKRTLTSGSSHPLPRKIRANSSHGFISNLGTPGESRKDPECEHTTDVRRDGQRINSENNKDGSGTGHRPSITNRMQSSHRGSRDVSGCHKQLNCTNRLKAGADKRKDSYNHPMQGTNIQLHKQQSWCSDHIAGQPRCRGPLLNDGASNIGPGRGRYTRLGSSSRPPQMRTHLAQSDLRYRRNSCDSGAQGRHSTTRHLLNPKCAPGRNEWHVLDSTEQCPVQVSGGARRCTRSDFDVRPSVALAKGRTKPWTSRSQRYYGPESVHQHARVSTVPGENSRHVSVFLPSCLAMF